VNHADNAPLPSANYVITTSGGSQVSGQASDSGITRLVVTSPAEQLKVRLTDESTDNYHLHYCDAFGRVVCGGDNSVNRIV
jgi:type VI secretion system secreted protein VgrG